MHLFPSRTHLWLPLIGLLLCFATPANAQEPTPSAMPAASAAAAAANTPTPPTKKLILGTKNTPPFAIKGSDGAWRGITIDMWRDIATDLHYEYEFRETNLQGLITGLENNTYDASVAALTITHERELHVDFSHPFYSAGLGVAVRTDGRSELWAWLWGLFSTQVWKVVAVLAAVIFLPGFLIWLAERRANPEQFGGGVWKGLGAGFWWSAVTMTTVGYGDKAPQTFLGRTIALVWMFAAVITISGFTAGIASALTRASFGPTLNDPNDLAEFVTGVVKNSTSEQSLTKRHLSHRSYDNLADALKALGDGSVQAVVHDKPVLQYVVHQQFPGGEVHVVELEFDRQNYGIGLPEGSAMREPLNRAILKMLSSDRWRDIQFEYLGAR